MQEIEFNKLSYVSSEDKEFPGDNLVYRKKWLCKVAEAKAVVNLQLKNDNQINKIEIRNEGSAFVEVLVGKENMEDDDFQVLLSCSSFMNPAESENGKNKHQIKVFTKDQLQKSVSEQAWNIVKVVCTQPFNKKVGYGLGFIKLFSVQNLSSSTSLPFKLATNSSIQTDSTKQTDVGHFKLKNTNSSSSNITIGSFFRRSREASQEYGNQSCKKKKIDTDTNGLKDIRFSGSTATISSTTQNIKFPKSTELQSNNKASTTKTLPLQQPSTHYNQTMNATTTQSIRSFPSPLLSTRKYFSLKSSPKQSSDSQLTKPTEAPKATVTSSLHQTSSSSTLPHIVRSSSDVLTGVVFVLSGFQNPERSNLRDMATGMGAVYCHDWCPEATHLICAFADTPKYVQVNGKGRIVKKEWLLQCQRQLKLLSWKRYRLGKAKSPKKSSIDDRVEEDDDKGDDEDSDEEEEEDYEDSEDNFIVEDDEDEETGDDTDEDDDNDTVFNEEVSKKKKNKSSNSNYKKKVNYKASVFDVSSTNRVKSFKASLKKPSSPPSSPPSSSSPSSFSPQLLTFQAPSSPQASSSHASPPSSSSLHYDKLISKDHKLPSFLNQMNIFFYGEFSNYEKNFLTRYIIAYDGKVCDYMGEDVQVVITKKNWDSNFDQAIKENEDLVFLKPEWLLQCIIKQKLISFLPQFRVVNPSEND